MGEIVNFPISLDSDLGRQLIIDSVRFAEGLIDEQAVRKKYRLTDDVWEALGNNDAFIEKITDEKLRRTRDGSTKREKSQQLITKAPGILDSIMSDPAASPRHRVDAIKTLDTFAANGPEGVPAADRFQITIILNSDDSNQTLHFNKSIRALSPGETDPADIGPDTDTMLEESAAIASKKPTDDSNGNAI